MATGQLPLLSFTKVMLRIVLDSEEPNPELMLRSTPAPVEITDLH